jgi:hypothetical protein
MLGTGRMAMTRKELAQFDKRIASRIARKGIASRPISESEKRRFEELRRKKEAAEHAASERYLLRA